MDADQRIQESCASIPWQLPTTAHVVQARDALPTPQGYAESKMMIGQTITEMHNFCQWEIAVRQTPWMNMARGLCRKHRR